MDDRAYKPSETPFAFFVGFLVGVSLLFLMLAGTVESYLLLKNAHTATVLEVLDFQPGFRTADEFEPSQSEVRIRDNKSGKITTLWVDGDFKAGETVNVGSSARDGTYAVGITEGKLRGGALVTLVVVALVIGLGRVGGRDAIYYLLGPEPRQFSRSFAFGALAVTTSLMLAVAVTASWGWPYEYYARFRALCAAGLAVMAFGAWSDYRNTKLFSGCCAILAIVYVVGTFPKGVWNGINFLVALLAALAGMVALARVWPYESKQT